MMTMTPTRVELPVEVVERVLPLVPVCTLLRARAVSRCVLTLSERPRGRWRGTVAPL